MCSQQQVVSAVGGRGQHQVPRDCPTYWYMPHPHRLFVVFHSFHDPVWGQLEGNNLYLTLSLHGVLRPAKKMYLKGTMLYQMILSQMCVAQICCIEHYTHTQSIFFVGPFYVLTLIHQSIFTCWV